MSTPRPVGQGSQDGQDSEDDLDLFEAWDRDLTSLVAGASIPSPIPSRHLAFQMLRYFYHGFSDDFFLTGNLAWLFGNSKEDPAGAVLRAAFWMRTKIGTALRRYMAEGEGATAFEAQEDVEVSCIQSC